MIINEISTNLSAASLQVRQIQIVRGFLSGPRDRQWDHVLLLVSKPSQPVAFIESAQFLIQMWKELPKLYVLDPSKTSWLLSLDIYWIISVIEIDFIVPFNFKSISIYFVNWRGRVQLAGNSLKAEKWHWQVQKVTLAGPKSLQASCTDLFPQPRSTPYHSRDAIRPVII